MSAVRIVLANEHALLREALRRLIESEPGLLVVGEAADTSDAVRLSSELLPDILLLDVTSPASTNDVLRGLSEAAPATRVILLTALVDKAELLRAVLLGARGLVPKSSRLAVLVKAIRAVVAGEYWAGRESLVELVDLLRSAVTAQTARPDFGLTKRECEVVSAVAEGCANKDIAERFSISEKTVKHHMTNIFDKTGVSNRLELALFAREHKLEADDLPAPPLRDGDELRAKRRSEPSGTSRTH